MTRLAPLVLGWACIAAGCVTATHAPRLQDGPQPALRPRQGSLYYSTTIFDESLIDRAVRRPWVLGQLSPSETAAYETTVRAAFPGAASVTLPAAQGVTIAMFAETGPEDQRQGEGSAFNCGIAAAFLFLWPCVAPNYTVTAHYVLYRGQQPVDHARYSMRNTRIIWALSFLALPFTGANSSAEEVRAMTRDFLAKREPLLTQLLLESRAAR